MKLRLRPSSIDFTGEIAASCQADMPHAHNHSAPIQQKRTSEELEQLTDDLIGRCRKAGLRKTFLLTRVLRFLLEQNQPVNVQAILNAPEVDRTCDVATAYRLLGRLEEHGLIRRIGMHERSAHFILNLPGMHRDFLICTDCGKVDVIQLPCPVKEMESEVSKQSGYGSVYHELQFFGKCPGCSEKSG